MVYDQVSQLAKKIGSPISLAGWVDGIRSSGSICFIQFRDGSGVVQAVVDKGSVSEDVFARARTLTRESSLTLVGTCLADERAPGGVEIRVHEVAIIQRCSEEYPIGNKEHGVDFLLDHRHLWLRSSRQWAILRVRDRVIRGISDFFHEEAFVKVDSPIFTPNACEGTTELFSVKYVNDDIVYLSQSGQLYLEAAIASLGRVYDFGPTFRAEKSKTRRHLTEFWMMDAEAAFFEHDDNIALQERLVVALVQGVLADCAHELKILERDTVPLTKITAPFVRMTYDEAVRLLQSLGSAITPGMDFGNEDETLLTTQYEKPVIVEKYPTEVKAFYMKPDPADPSRVLCNDLLAPEGYGEIIGGSQREDSYDALVARIRAEKLPEDDFQWYLDLRKFGSVPHSGFGLGLERFVAWMCGVHHIREAIPFPRTIYRVFP